MTNEEIVEEILHEAHRLGIHKQVLELASKSSKSLEIDKIQEAFDILSREIVSK
jgi:hypothetical protein